MKNNHKITQHFFFFTKRKPVLKEKQICSFGKAFLSKKRFLEQICSFGKAFLSKKRFLVNSRGLLIAICYWNDYKYKETFMTRWDTHDHENNKVFSYQR
jgi:hypothetical protein